MPHLIDVGCRIRLFDIVIEISGLIGQLVDAPFLPEIAQLGRQEQFQTEHPVQGGADEFLESVGIDPHGISAPEQVIDCPLPFGETERQGGRQSIAFDPLDVIGNRKRIDFEDIL
ncbi:hypothetical protein SDC9_132260 [bioreactor metagenome]|uniref:Uncharacterized protein n=1 Tax=bioreactor metagenome TaxID=1076179 RepID=A0A645D988_9ZZZZ